MLRNLSCLSMVAVVAVASATPAQADYVDAVMASNPVLYYRMQEASVDTGDPADNSATTGATYDGTYTFPTIGSITDIAGVNVDLSPAKQFTGDDGYIDVPGGFAGDALNAFSFEFFFRPNASTWPTGEFDVISIFSSDGWDVVNGGQVHLSLRDNGNFELAMPLNTWSPIDLQTYASDDAWTHVVVTYTTDGEDNSTTLFTNGVQRSVTAGTGGGQGDFTLDAEIASYADLSDRFLTAGLDEFAIYDYALSAGEVATHYAAVPEPSSLALLAVAGGASAWMLRRRRK